MSKFKFIRVDKVQPYRLNGNKEYIDKIVNVDEISTVEKRIDVDGIIIIGEYILIMKNSEKFNARIDDDTLHKLCLDWCAYF